MSWLNNARGLYVDKKVSVPSIDILRNYDYLIANTDDNFTLNVQAAYDAGIPCIMFVTSYITKSIIDQGISQNMWSAIESTDIGKQVQRYLYSGSVRRVVHGIMIDCSTIKDDVDGLLTSTWITSWQSYILDKIYKKYALPIYMYMNKSPINLYKGTDGEQAIIQMLKKYGVSTPDFSNTIARGFPSDLDSPDLPYNGGNDWRWYFWLFDFNPLTFLYNGTKEWLYNELGYESSVIPDDNPTIPPDEETPEIIPVDLSELNKKIDDIKSELDIVLDLLGEIRQHFS